MLEQTRDSDVILVQFSPVGHYFASASHDRTARIWSMDRIQPLRIMAGHLSDVDVSTSLSLCMRVDIILRTLVCANLVLCFTRSIYSPNTTPVRKKVKRKMKAYFLHPFY